MTGLPVPIDVPTRAVLHYRTQLALSLLQQREPCAQTTVDVKRVLEGGFDELFQSSKEVS